MGSAYTNTKRKGGKPTRSQKLFRLTILLSALAISCAAVYTVVVAIQSEEAEAIEDELPYGSLSELSHKDTFLTAYLSVNCDAQLLQSTQSIQVRGTIEAAQSRFFDRIISAYLGIGHILSIEASDWKGRECLKVQTEDPTGEQVTLVIDPSTMYPLAEQMTQADGRIRESVMRDYRNIGGMPIPFEIETSTENTPISRIQLEHAAINTGLLSKLFEVPESLTVE